MAANFGCFARSSWDSSGDLGSGWTSSLTTTCQCLTGRCCACAPRKETSSGLPYWRKHMPSMPETVLLRLHRPEHDPMDHN